MLSLPMLNSAVLSAILAIVGEAPLQQAPEPAPEHAPPELRATLAWLIAAMPEGDRGAVDGAFLLAHAQAAFDAWQSAPWQAQVNEELFRDAILPYANVSESRELWLPKLRELCLPLVAGAGDPGRAAVLVNQGLFAKVGVRYSTERERADQSPSESMASGLASCTGLAILLVDACRSVGVPARFVGVPLWTDRSGNHSWVEVWDGARWRYTGAAEPSGDALDAAWFSGRAAGQSHEPPEHAIYAVTWRESPLEFPMVFDPARPRARAIDVTDRYAGAAEPVPDGHQRVHVALRGRDGKRVAREVVVLDTQRREVARGTSKDERFDSNDHLALVLPLGVELVVEAAGRTLTSLNLGSSAAGNVPTIEWTLDSPAAASALAELAAFLRDHPLDEVASQPFAQRPLAKAEIAPIRALLVEQHAAMVRARDRADFDARIVTAAGTTMRYWFTTCGEKPANGRSLWISLHGGGGAPAAVNDQQWENQKRLYQPSEGVYLAPRGPTDSWNLWHQGHLDPLLTRLIADLVVFEGVDPDRVYLMGYSAGGDGVYQLGPRMADQLAAAAMMAGHPNETRPDGLRNLPFTLHMGGDDNAYDRANIARNWKKLLANLAGADPGGYPHEVVIHEGKGHWMDREDAVAVPWMAKYTRNLRPTKVIWLQDDVTSPRFYWLMNPAPKGGQRVEVVREGQVITIVESTDIETLVIRLDDSMLDLSKPVVVKALLKAAVEGDPSQNAVVLFEGIAPRTLSTMARTLIERSDATGIFTAEITVKLPTAAPAIQP